MSERHRYECVQPELGDELWRLDDPDTDPRLREWLVRHRAVCDACRLTRAIGNRLQGEVATGSVVIGTDGDGAGMRRPSWRRPAHWIRAGGLALAASLVLVFVLPPSTTGLDLLFRTSVEQSGILRPVEDERLVTDTPRIAWLPVAGASEYRVTIRQVDGRYRWQDVVTVPELVVPGEADLPAGARLRAIVEPVPDDLLPPGELSVTFRRTGYPRFAIYRLAAAPVPVKALLSLGLILVIFGLGRVLHHRRVDSVS